LGIGVKKGSKRKNKETETEKGKEENKELPSVPFSPSQTSQWRLRTRDPFKAQEIGSMWPQTRLRGPSRPALPLVSAPSRYAALNWKGLRWLYARYSGIKGDSRAALMVSLSLTVTLVLRAEKRLVAVKRRIAVKSLAASV
jgi:hypothetical protein